MTHREGIAAQMAIDRPEVTDASANHSERRVPKLLMSYEEASWSMGVSERTLRNMVNDGRLPAVKFCKRTLFYIEDLRAVIRTHRTAAGESGLSGGPESVQSG